MPTPLMVFVGADKGGVGKTTVARAAIDYMGARGARPRVYDTEHPLGGIARFAFAGAEVVDLSRVAGKLKVFDAVDANPVTLVDMRAGLMSATLHALEEAGLLAAVRAGEINLALLHVLGPTPESLAEIAAATKLIGGRGRSRTTSWRRPRATTSSPTGRGSRNMPRSSAAWSR